MVIVVVRLIMVVLVLVGLSISSVLLKVRLKMIVMRFFNDIFNLVF